MDLTATYLTVTAAAVMLVLLSIAVSLRRRAVGLPTGFGDDAELMVRIRAQANFVEYTPFALVVVALVEMGGGSLAAAVLGAMLVLGRASHAAGMYRRALVPRVVGMVLTYAVLLAGAALLLLRTF